jgi:hypothetical protein
MGLPPIAPVRAPKAVRSATGTGNFARRDQIRTLPSRIVNEWFDRTRRVLGSPIPIREARYSRITVRRRGFDGEVGRFGDDVRTTR